MVFDPSKPYNDLPLLPPKADIETRAVLKACIEARAALAELKQAGKLIPNQAVLINSIPLLEARSSSEIENIVTTADRLFLYSGAESGADAPTKEALRYRTALRLGFEQITGPFARPLSTSTAVLVCRAIKHVELDVRKTPGTTLINGATGAVVYTPPQGEVRLRKLLANWERFIHEAEAIDPIVRMAVQHYQFEAIHPFVDGNGRTGRILNLLFLVEKDLLELPILYLSRAILKRRADYYRLLNAVTSHESWEEWIQFMLQAVVETARWTTEKINAIHRLLDATSTYLREVAPAIYSRELAELIFVQPYCRISNVVEAGLARRETASIYLKRLSDVGVLGEQKSGREKLYINLRLLELLTGNGHAFAPLPARRTGRVKAR